MINQKCLVLGLAFVTIWVSYPVLKMTLKMELHFILLFLQLITPTFCGNICMADICIPSNYSSAIVPKLDDGNKVEVDISDIQILNVDDFGKQNLNRYDE